MSNLIFNLRLGIWHVQIVNPRDWRHNRPIRISRNPYQAERRANDPSWRWFELMEARWPW